MSILGKNIVVVLILALVKDNKPWQQLWAFQFLRADG